jgi:FMN-dependent NADH-azoreductase
MGKEAANSIPAVKILFINACLRGRERSRTDQLCRAFLDGLSRMANEQRLVVEEVNLAAEKLPCYGAEEIEQRAALLDAGRLEDPFFDFARQYKAADLILCGAPYWDFSFPAALKSYFERICVEKYTFCYTDEGPAGLCAFRDFVYITTCGGYVGGLDLGTDYARAIAGFTGQGAFHAYACEGLDMLGNHPVRILDKARGDMAALAESISLPQHTLHR